MKHPLALSLLLIMAQGPAPALAEVHALLIGVGDYLYLDADLQGPPNDARLMAETLQARGAAEGLMTVLSSDLTGLPAGVRTGVPDRASILGAMAGLSETAAPGDTVFFYFSGHGSQAPDQSGDEGGGYDEIFLPADARNWQGEIGAVENAITDDEFELWARDLLAKDIRLIAVMDACHSATGFRGIGEETGAAAAVARSLDPQLLGIPEAMAPAGFTPAEPLQGDYVFLYSSQADERSYEYPLGDSGLWHGEFTLRLAQVLSEVPDASWAQVLGAVSDSMVQGPARQMPDGEGSLLEARVFGEGRGEQRLRIKDGRVMAGLLQGLSQGAELALYASAAGGEPLGRVTLGETGLRDAALEGDLPEAAAWAERAALPPPEALRLAAPRLSDAEEGRDYSAWLAALEAAGAGAGAETGAGARADLVPLLRDGALILAGPDGLADAAGPGSSLRVTPVQGESEAEALQRMLDQLAWGMRLEAVLASAAGRGLLKSEVIRVDIEKRAGEALTSAGEAGKTCSGKADAALPFDPKEGVRPCDQLWLTLTNRSGKDQDISVLYRAADYEIQPIYPSDHMVNRLKPGESLRVGLQIDPFEAAAREEIWILAVPAGDALSPRSDLTILASLPGQRAAPDSLASEMALWLDQQSSPPDEDLLLRGFSLKPAALTMIRQSLTLLPGGE